MKKKTKRYKAVLFVALLCALLPLLCLVVLSFHEHASGYIALKNIENPIWRAYANSLIVCEASLLGQLLIGILGGWGLAHYRFPGRRVLLFLCITLMLMPVQALLLPQYLLLRQLGLLNTVWALVLLGSFSPLGTVLLWNGFRTIPKQILEAAECEGANLPVLITKIALPMCKRELSALVLVSIAESWNLLEQPMAYISSAENYPLSVYLATAAIDNATEQLAACVVALVPVALAFCLLQQNGLGIGVLQEKHEGLFS